MVDLGAQFLYIRCKFPGLLDQFFASADQLVHAQSGPIPILIHGRYLSTPEAILEYVKTLPNAPVENGDQKPARSARSRPTSKVSSRFHAAREFSHLHRTAHHQWRPLMNACGLNIEDAPPAVAGAATGLLSQETDRIDFIEQA